MGIKVNIITISDRIFAASLQLAISLTIARDTEIPTEAPSPWANLANSKIFIDVAIAVKIPATMKMARPLKRTGILPIRSEISPDGS